MSPSQYGTMNSLDPLADHNTSSHHRRSTDMSSRSRRSLGLDSRSVALRSSTYEEFDPFLTRSRPSSPSSSEEMPDESRSRKVSSFWMLPLVLLAGFARGMSTPPRIEVYTQIACDELHMDTSIPPFQLSLNVTPSQTPSLLFTPPTHEQRRSDGYSPFYTPYDPLGWTPIQARSISTPPVECLHDPAVQARAAGIQATLATIIGVLSIITAGYWGQISDAFGRKVVLSVNMLGMVFQSVVYVLVNMPGSIFRRYAWQVLISGPIVEGLLGSMTTHHAAQNAYLADCAQSGSRSTVFAYYQGASYIALASGPQLARIVLDITGTDARTTMFYVALILDAAAFTYALFMPETVTSEMMQAARGSVLNARNQHSESLKMRERWKLQLKDWRDRILAPLAIFAPKRKPGGGWELNMTCLVIAQFTHLMSVGIWQLKLLYAQHTYAWSVKELGYYISLLWTLRAFHLLLLLPTILRFVRPIRSSSTSVALSQDITFDYHVAQVSIFIEAAAYVLTLIAPSSSQVLFVIFTSLSSFTAGVNPAIHSLAVSYLLAFHSDANIGRMFGGMSMLQAVAHTLQPILFGFVYSETAATYPKAIFALAAGLLLSSSALFALLRTNVSSRVDEAVEDEEEEVASPGHEETNRPLLRRES